MAASVVNCLRFSGICHGIRSVLKTNLAIHQRILIPLSVTQVQPTRGARRTCKPPRYFVKKNLDHRLSREELTPESRTFLDQVAMDRLTATMEESPLRSAPVARNPYTFHTIRCGVLAIKIGTIPQWTKDGKRIICTMLQVLDNHVVRYVPPEVYSKQPQYKFKQKRYGSVVVGALSMDPFKFTKQYNNLFAEAGIPPKRKLTRFIVTSDAALEPGTPLKATHFQVGDYVDCQAKTIGRGFQGVVKRWGFKGGPASHGTTKFHRRPGSIGGGKGKDSIYKGRKMPGHMGMEYRKLMGLKVHRINTKYNVLYVTGGNIPGPTHCYVRVYDSQLRNRRAEHSERQVLMPTYYPGDITPLPEEIFDENLFQFTEPTITYQEKDK